MAILNYLKWTTRTLLWMRIRFRICLNSSKCGRRALTISWIRIESSSIGSISRTSCRQRASAESSSSNKITRRSRRWRMAMGSVTARRSRKKWPSSWSQAMASTISTLGSVAKSRERLVDRSSMTPVEMTMSFNGSYTASSKEATHLQPFNRFKISKSKRSR